MRMRRSRALTFLLVFSMLTLGCGKPKPEVDPDAEPRVLSADEKWDQISDRGWEIMSLNRKDVMSGSYLDLHLTSDWQASGSAGCNTWFAVVAVRQGNGIRFTKLESTRRECSSPKGVMEQEALFFELLQLADGFELEGEELIFYNGNRPVITLMPKL